MLSVRACRSLVSLSPPRGRYLFIFYTRLPFSLSFAESRAAASGSSVFSNLGKEPINQNDDTSPGRSMRLVGPPWASLTSTTAPCNIIDTLVRKVCFRAARKQWMAGRARARPPSSEPPSVFLAPQDTDFESLSQKMRKHLAKIGKLWEKVSKSKSPSDLDDSSVAQTSIDDSVVDQLSTPEQNEFTKSLDAVMAVKLDAGKKDGDYVYLHTFKVRWASPPPLSSS